MTSRKRSTRTSGSTETATPCSCGSASTRPTALILARTLRENGSLEADRTLSVLGAAAQEPDIAVNEAGDVAFAWTRWDGMRDRVMSMVDLASAFPGTPSGSRRSVRSPGRQAESTPTATRSSAGSAGTAAPADPDGPAPANGASTWSRRIRGRRERSDPELAMEAGGTAAIAWERWDGPIRRIQVRRLPEEASPAW